MNPALAPKAGTTSQGPPANASELQKDAKALLELAQSIQADADALSQGLLPKDTSEKLKQIQKTAKHMRGQIGP
jgi:hypothetical protein